MGVLVNGGRTRPLSIRWFILLKFYVAVSMLTVWKKPSRKSNADNIPEKKFLLSAQEIPAVRRWPKDGFSTSFAKPVMTSKSKLALAGFAPGMVAGRLWNLFLP